MKKCGWCLGSDIYEHYHDTEWGIPIYDSQSLFEKFCLESFQAGLSWLTILKKRDNFYAAFDNLNPSVMAYYDNHKINDLMNNVGIVRHHGKIIATINNAQAYLKIAEQISFADYLWGFVNHMPLKNHFKTLSDLPSQTELSQKISKDLKQKGFKFCGPTMVYAFMQGVGIVNDHITECFKYSA